VSKQKQIKSDIEAAHKSIAGLAEEAAPHKDALDIIYRKRQAFKSNIKALEKELSEINQRPGVTDHAVIRYLERKHGFNFEGTRKEMLTPTVLAAMNMGAGSVKTEGGVLKIQGKTVVTFAPKQQRKSTPKPRSARHVGDKQAIRESMNNGGIR